MLVIFLIENLKLNKYYHSDIQLGGEEVGLLEVEAVQLPGLIMVVMMVMIRMMLLRMMTMMLLMMISGDDNDVEDHLC